MIDAQTLQRDSAIMQAVMTPTEDKPRIAWDELFGNDAGIGVEVRVADGSYPLSLRRLAGIIGGALADLRRAEDHAEIDSHEAKQLVRALAEEVAARLGKGSAAIDEDELYKRIEQVLLARRQYDLAKAMVLQHANRLPPVEVGTVRLIRRSGQIVPWNGNKIEIAIRKAFIGLKQDSSPAPAIAATVTERVLASQQSFVHIEEVQDLVQEELMKAGHFKVAEAYILYRARRQMERDFETRRFASDALEPAADHLEIVDWDGRPVPWTGEELDRRIEFALVGLEDDIDMDRDVIAAELRRSLYSGIDREGLKTTIILNAKSLMERDAELHKFAGRILLTYVYEEVLDWDLMRDGIGALKAAHQRYLERYVEHGIAIGRLSPRLREYDLRRLSLALDPSSDWDFDYLGIQTLYDRYLIVDKTGAQPRRIETPQIFWMRVAMGLFLDEPHDRESWAIRLYNLYRTRRFCSSTPTLFNSGTQHSQLSSCYLYWVGDSIEQIMQRGIAENAYLSKWAGGLGGSWTSVRGTGAHIRGTNGESQGVIPFLKLHNDQLVAVNQGGKRRGSGCAYLETWHNDLFEFLELRRNTGDDRRRCHDMNTANWIPDLFMKRMEERGDWTFFRANEVADLHDTYGKEFEERYQAYEQQAREGRIFGESMPALEVWKKMLRMLFETGHPWITFKDPCNVRSPQDHVGMIHSSNLCTEITLNTGPDETAVCNLGSVVLDNHLDADGGIDHDTLRETIRIAQRALDNVIDINLYPTDAARTANQRHRPIGMGVMGLQHALYRKDLPFASTGAVEFADELMEAVAYYAYEASSDLAAERGTYSTYAGSKWDRGILPQDSIDLLAEERGRGIDVPRGGRLDWAPLRAKIAAQGMRNSNVLAIAPTATIANITGTSPCIEPTYKNLYVKSNLSGEFIVLNQHLVRDLKKRGLWTDEMRENLKYFDGELADIPGVPEDIKAKYATAFGIPYQFLIDSAARRQKWIDQAQSLNLFLGEPDMKTLSHMYRHAWSCGLKTTYYLRTLGASNIEKATVGKRPQADSVPEQTGASVAPATAAGKACSILDPDCEACQ